MDELLLLLFVDAVVFEIERAVFLCPEVRSVLVRRNRAVSARVVN